MGRRPPGVVRHAETVCRSHERAAHCVHGLSAGVIAAVTVLEHGRLQPGDVARALRRWEAAARRGEVYRPGSEPCGVAECCGPGPRDVLEEAIRGLPRRSRPALRQMVGQVDATFLLRAVRDIVLGAGQTRAVFEAEPVNYRWTFRGEGGSVVIRILEVGDSDWPDAAGLVIWAACPPVEVLGRAVARGFDQVIRELGADRYQRQWDRPFPHAELEAVHAALRASPPAVSAVRRL
jgi:hypothetical protein